uniref:hypothetical protein n=1 Tax=Sphingomonas bacterium TaxID=1895847 RepID=UPI00262F4EAC
MKLPMPTTPSIAGPTIAGARRSKRLPVMASSESEIAGVHTRHRPSSSAPDHRDIVAAEPEATDDD